MAINPKDSEFENIEALIDEFIQIDPQTLFDVDFCVKLDVLERTIELLRFRRKQLKNTLGFEKYIQGYLFADNESIHFCLPEEHKDLGAGIPPSYYQPKLLLFLLIYHREKYRVIDIIEMFVKTEWEELGPLDFKKTETGVIRCYTNIRFAARTLRYFGLIRFTQREAYKTWELSLLGFLVASIFHRDGSNHDKKYVNQGQFLERGIIDALEKVKDYADFVNCLARICKPDIRVFETFKDMLKEAYVLLSKYQTVLRKENMTKKERLEYSLELVHQLEKLPDIDKFYREFSKCISVNRLLDTV